MDYISYKFLQRLLKKTEADRQASESQSLDRSKYQGNRAPVAVTSLGGSHNLTGSICRIVVGIPASPGDEERVREAWGKTG